MAVKWDRQMHTVKLLQTALIQKIINQFGQSDAVPLSLPMEPGLKLYEHYATNTLSQLSIELRVANIVKSHPEFKKPLELRQISNILTKARYDARVHIHEMGGDFNVILTELKQRSMKDGWFYEVMTDTTNTVVAIFWQMDIQVALGKHFSDVLLNDNSYNRNKYGYSLNL
ncbi:hypothetical protein C0992_006926, partial [Termitomyces sp. T32_za158]